MGHRRERGEGLAGWRRRGVVLTLGMTALLAAMAGGCSTSGPTQIPAASPPGARSPAPLPAGAPLRPPTPTPDLPETKRAAVRAEALRWIGTPHRLGGADAAGMDCSGLVWLVFQNAAGLKLPRVAAEQARFGRPASLAGLRAGDLLFFQTPGSGKINHVGIYLENGRFIHASTQRGVVVSRLAEPYYSGAYRGARVVLKE